MAEDRSEHERNKGRKRHAGTSRKGIIQKPAKPALVEDMGMTIDKGGGKPKHVKPKKKA